jgi:DinB superfamily
MPQIPTKERTAYFAKYIDLVEERQMAPALRNTVKEMETYLRSISEDRAGHSYAPGKWTIRQMIQHIIDTERIFAYRALSFARGESQPLPGFTEDDFANEAPADDRTLDSLIKELKAVRTSTILLFKSFNASQLKRIGTASGNPLSCRAAGFIIAGHTRHHLNILKERYQ